MSEDKIKVGDWVTVNDVHDHPYVTANKKYEVEAVLNNYVGIFDDVNAYHEIYIDNLTPTPKTTPRPHAELIKRWADDDKMVIEFYAEGLDEWIESETPEWHPARIYREKHSEPNERDLIMQDIQTAQDNLNAAKKRLQELEK